jgi:membrane-bound ClpP family serine protease
MLRTGLRVFFIAWLVIPIAAGLAGNLLAAASPTTVEVLTVDGTIVPVIADYIDRGISQAEKDGAHAKLTLQRCVRCDIMIQEIAICT